MPTKNKTSHPQLRYKLIRGYKCEDMIGLQLAKADILKMIADEVLPEGAEFIRAGVLYHIEAGKLKVA